jgi:hypothetical protein
VALRACETRLKKHADELPGELLVDHPAAEASTFISSSSTPCRAGFDIAVSTKRGTGTIKPV